MHTVSDDDRTWGSLAHLSALCGMLIPFGSLLGPLIIWRTRGQRAAFVGDQALEALNFNISIAIGLVACLALVWLFIGILMAFALVIYWIVMTVVATLKAGEGHRYRYPIALRLIK
ncbi:MAG TPA: DUF4870 domain-containing protein [Steroidobacteraceae bacterium]